MSNTPTQGPPRNTSGWGIVIVLGVIVCAALFAWHRFAGDDDQVGGRGAGPASGDAAAEAFADELAVIQNTVADALEKDEPDLIHDKARRFVDRFPKKPAARNVFAQVLLAEQQFERAYKQLKVSLELDPRQPNVHLLAGTIAYQFEDLDQAERHYKDATSLDRRNVDNHLHLAKLYMKQGKMDRARITLVAALNVDSSSHEAHAMLADLYARQNKLTLAITQISKAIEMTPTDERPRMIVYVRTLSKMLRRDNQFDQALQVLDGIEGDYRHDPGVVEGIAVCYMMLSRPADAVGAYEEAVAANPVGWELVAGAARWQHKTGNAARARHHLATLKRLKPDAGAISELESALAGGD